MRADNPLFGVVTTKFHGGGLLFSTRSPREAHRFMRMHHDGCYDGSGCESYAISYDGGETWYIAELDYQSNSSTEYGPHGCDHAYTYADCAIGVTVHMWRGSLLRADATLGACEPCL